MRETLSVLNVLTYLLNHKIMESDWLEQHNLSKVTLELEYAGFSKENISSAFDWLRYLKALMQSLADMPTPSDTATRLFTESECNLISNTCRQYLFYLETCGILNSSLREMVIDLVIALKSEGVDISLMKWVTLMVLYHVPNNNERLKQMEFLLLDESIGGIH